MRIPRIYLDKQFSSEQALELSEDAFQHAIKVLRLKQGAQLILFNGHGDEYSATVETVNKRNATVLILEQREATPESNIHIHLALGISKGERMDYAIQKAVELGVAEITPLFTEHCVVNLDDKRMQKKIHHWQGIIISACEQSGRCVLPVLNNPLALSHWSNTADEIVIIFDPTATQGLSTIKPEAKKITLVIGPEGGLSEMEIMQLKNRENFHAVKFGPRILRTETAAVAALTAAQLLWGDLLK